MIIGVPNIVTFCTHADTWNDEYVPTYSSNQSLGRTNESIAKGKARKFEHSSSYLMFCGCGLQLSNDKTRIQTASSHLLHAQCSLLAAPSDSGQGNLSKNILEMSLL